MASMDDILSALKNGVQAINSLATIIQSTFPQSSSAITHSATAGPDTLPAKPSGFLTITVNGTTYKVPLYDS